MSVHIRTAAKRFDDNGKHTGPGEWLDVIHQANRIKADMFGQPYHTGPWWAGGYVEEYPDARVLMRGDESVSIFSKTDDGEAVLRQAAADLGITVAS